MEPKMTVLDAAQFLNMTSQGIIKRMKSQNLDFKKIQNRVYFGYSTAKQIFNIKIAPTVIATQIVKGGTGKSSLTMNLAIRANLYGLKVLCIDLDQQANLSILFGVNDSEYLPVMHDVIKSDGKLKIENNLIEIFEGLHLFPSKLENAALDDAILINGLGVDRAYKDIIDPLKSYYDVIFIDCPPALGRSVVAAAYAADKIIAPVTPDKLCVTGLRMLHNLLLEIKESKYGRSIPYEIIYNKFDNRTSLSKDILTSLLTNETYKEKLNENYIRQSQEFPNSTAKKTSIYDTFKTTTAKEDIDAVIRSLLNLGTNVHADIEEATKISIISIATNNNKTSKKSAVQG
jgi:chromosome partitioning protein